MSSSSVEFDHNNDINSHPNSLAFPSSPLQLESKERIQDPKSSGIRKHPWLPWLILVVVLVGLITLVTVLLITLNSAPSGGSDPTSSFKDSTPTSAVKVQQSSLRPGSKNQNSRGTLPPSESPIKVQESPTHSPTTLIDDSEGTVTTAWFHRWSTPSPTTPITPPPTRVPPTAVPTSTTESLRTMSSCAPVSNTPPQPLPGKKGVCLTLRPTGQTGSWIDHAPIVLALQPYWNYHWGLDRSEGQPDTTEFIPMVWGASSVTSRSALQDQLQTMSTTGQVRHLLGFNEPDQAEQSNVSVETALELWPALESSGLSLISPSAAAPLGSWMKEFMAQAALQCKRVDYVGVHWYGGVNATGFQSKMKEIYQFYGKPLIVTEFASVDWQATSIETNRFSSMQILQFMKIVVPWMEEQDWIAGYAWFSFPNDFVKGAGSALFDRDMGELTPLGRFYASVTTENPQGDQSISV